jgi:hypothetical protein
LKYPQERYDEKKTVVLLKQKRQPDQRIAAGIKRRLLVEIVAEARANGNQSATVRAVNELNMMEGARMPKKRSTTPTCPLITASALKEIYQVSS